MIALNSIKSPHRSTSFFTSQNGRACFLWADLLPNSGWGKKELSHPWPVLLWNFLIRKSTFPPLGEIWEEKRKEVKKLLYWMSLSKTSEKAMAPHSSILAWKIPRAEEPGRLQSMGSRRTKDWVTSLSLFTFMHWRRKRQPTPVFLPGESRDGGAWWAAVYGVAQSRTRLKRLSSSSSSLGQRWVKHGGACNEAEG